MTSTRTTYSTPETIPVDARAMKSLQEKLLVLRPATSKAQWLCAAEFVRMGASLHVLMTERLDDAVAVFCWNKFHDHKVELYSISTARRPEAESLVGPKPLTDSAWNRLAGHARNRDTFNGPKSEWGRELADQTQGASFSLPDGRVIYVLTDGAAGVDIYTKLGGANSRVRHVVYLAFEFDDERDRRQVQADGAVTTVKGSRANLASASV